MGGPPAGQRSFVRGFGGDLLQREQGVDPEGIEWTQHEKRDPEIGQFLNPTPARGEQRQKIDAKKKEQPGAHADDERLRAIRLGAVSLWPGLQGGLHNSQ